MLHNTPPVRPPISRCLSGLWRDTGDIPFHETSITTPRKRFQDVSRNGLCHRRANVGPSSENLEVCRRMGEGYRCGLCWPLFVVQFRDPREGRGQPDGDDEAIFGPAAGCGNLEIVRLGVPRLGTWRQQKHGFYEKVIWPPMALRIGLLTSSVLQFDGRIKSVILQCRTRQ